MKIQTIIDIDPKNIPSGLSRRSFLKRIGGGLIIAVSISDFSVLEAAVAELMPANMNAYLRVGEDGMVTCFSGYGSLNRVR